MSLFKHKFLFRFTVSFFIQLFIKSFDDSFGSFLEITFRGTVFSIYYISLWVFFWYLSEYINKKIKSLRFSIKIVSNLLIGYVIGFISNGSYKLGDSYIFNKKKMWENISFFNPELVVGLTFIYLFLYVLNLFYEKDKEMREQQLKNDILEKDNIKAQFLNLKSQIEPHFLFNCLSVLEGIIHKDVNLASKFIVKLSNSLRYIIEENKFNLVSLERELFIIKDYFFLIKTRFRDSINLKIDLNIKSSNFYIAPLTIQLLIENAIKHNKFSVINPLHIEVKTNQDYIIIKNNLNKKLQTEPSPKEGIRNIESRYQLITDKKLEIVNNGKEFIVKLPLLKIKDYEHFNNRR